MIYFVQPEGGPIKIGYTLNDLRKRMAYYQPQIGLPFFVLGTMEGVKEEESRLHQRFARLRLRGDWFRPEPELLDFIAAETIPWPGRNSLGRKRKSGRQRPVWGEFLPGIDKEAVTRIEL